MIVCLYIHNEYISIQVEIMASTSLTLGRHWETFIKKQVRSGRYGSTSELIRDSLRLLEQRETKLEALRAALIEGEKSGTAGELDMDKIKKKARQKVGLVIED